jgi:hypothetical protein
MNLVRILAICIIVLGVVGVVIGGIFVGEGFAKNKLIVDRMNIEQVTLAVDPNNPNDVVQINNAAEAQQAADTIASHRRGIAPTYQALLDQGTGRFDPTNPTDLTYAQAMNLENYLYMAVTAFGLIQVTMASGAFMVVTGIALLLTGLVLNHFVRKRSLPAA